MWAEAHATHTCARAHLAAPSWSLASSARGSMASPLSSNTVRCPEDRPTCSPQQKIAQVQHAAQDTHTHIHTHMPPRDVGSAPRELQPAAVKTSLLPLLGHVRVHAMLRRPKEAQGRGLCLAGGGATHKGKSAQICRGSRRWLVTESAAVARYGKCSSTWVRKVQRWGGWLRRAQQ